MASLGKYQHIHFLGTYNVLGKRNQEKFSEATGTQLHCVKCDTV